MAYDRFTRQGVKTKSFKEVMAMYDVEEMVAVKKPYVRDERVIEELREVLKPYQK